LIAQCPNQEAFYETQFIDMALSAVLAFSGMARAEDSKPKAVGTVIMASARFTVISRADKGLRLAETRQAGLCG